MRRFTLVELMIVVAIVSILAAIAIPSFHELTLRSRLAESAPTVDGLVTATWAYEIELAAPQVLALAEHPRKMADLDRQALPWGSPGGDWATLGWAPDGDVRCNYAGGASAAPVLEAYAQSYCDLDENSSWFYANRRLSTSNEGPYTPFRHTGCKDALGYCTHGVDANCVGY